MNVEPDVGEVVQYEPEAGPSGPVAVMVTGPVQTREVPAAGYPGYRTETVGAVGVRLLSLEPRRKAATILALDGDVWLATSQAGAQAGAGGAMRWPGGVPYVCQHMHEVWACAVSGTVTVGVETVQWAE
jgi:hypothetical protein